MVTGAQWNQLPEKCGKANDVYRFHLRWSHRGVCLSACLNGVFKRGILTSIKSLMALMLKCIKTPVIFSQLHKNKGLARPREEGTASSMSLPTAMERHLVWNFIAGNEKLRVKC